MKKINQKDIKRIVSEATRRALNEISWGAAEDAATKSDNRTGMLQNAMYGFEEACSQMVQALNGEATEPWYDDDIQSQNTQGPRLAKKLAALEEEIWQYVNRKKKQLDSLSAHKQDKFNTAFGGRTYDEVADYIDDKWNKHFDEDNYVPWDEYRKQHLTPDEIEFNRRNP